jgi:cell division protein FtsN
MTKYAHQFIRKQRGGTVVGIIIGLIIGLAIALIVAVAITKTSLPFLNKVGKADKTPELTAGQTSDPNKPLYGNNNAAKEAAKGFAPEVPTPPAVPAAQADANSADAKTATPGVAAAPFVNPSPATPAKPGETKPVVTPKAAEAAPAAVVAAAKPDNADDKWMYYLQAGAFREQADAENSKAKLALAGFEASISDRSADVGGGALYRVRIGPFNQLEAMNKVRGKLSDNGIDVAVVRIAK